jgi:deazaflavin-dependent oxidoreductase (nitroreductase family)
MAQNPMSEQEFRRLRRFIRPFSALNRIVYRWTGGRWMGSFQGRPIMLVTMKGAKTGKPRTLPLMYVPYQDGVILVGSQGGAPTSPVWVKNVQRNPDVVVQVGDRKLELRARQVDEAEKARLWPICVQHYREYADYQARTDRSIPVFVCEPR